MPISFVPDSIYKLNATTDQEIENYQKKVPKWQVGNEIKSTTDYYRFAWRRWSKPDDTRTLIASIVPPRVSHVNNMMTFASVDARLIALLAGASASVIFDFLMKSFNKPNLWFDAIEKLPIIEGEAAMLIQNRALRLTCLTEDYKDLWESACGPEIATDSWVVDHPAFDNKHEMEWSFLDPLKWSKDVALRTEFARRQAVLEIDVLVAIALDLSLEELVTIYKHYFYTFSKYDASDEFDQNGLQLPNFVRQNPGRKEVRDELLKWDSKGSLTVKWKLESGTQEINREFFPPFFKVDRIEDYRIAYDVFSERLKS